MSKVHGSELPALFILFGIVLAVVFQESDSGPTREEQIAARLSLENSFGYDLLTAFTERNEMDQNDFVAMFHYGGWDAPLARQMPWLRKGFFTLCRRGGISGSTRDRSDIYLCGVFQGSQMVGFIYECPAGDCIEMDNLGRTLAARWQVRWSIEEPIENYPDEYSFATYSPIGADAELRCCFHRTLPDGRKYFTGVLTLWQNQRALFGPHDRLCGFTIR